MVRVVPNETIDQDDGLPIANGYNLAAPEGATTITPFTHLAAVQNKTLEEVAADLGLNVGDISGDYIAAKSGSSSNEAKQVHQVAQFIADQLQQNTAVDADLINKAVAVKEEVDAILANDPNADIDDFIIVVDGSGNASSSEIPSLEYSFSGETVYYNIWFDVEDDCGLGANTWVVEKVRYVPQGDATSGEYSLSNCALTATATFNYTETDQFDATGTFLSWLAFGDESFNRFDYLPTFNAFKTCFVPSENPADAPATCAEENINYEVANQDDAQALLDSLTALQASSELKITVEWVETLTAYSQGQAFTSGNSSMQCDLGLNYQIGDVETATVELVREGSTVTATVVDSNNNVEEEDLGDSWTYTFNTGTQTAVSNETGTDVDPTGQEGDIFSEDYEIDESYQWNANAGAFEGTLIDNSDLKWELDSSVSSCDRTFSIVMTPTSSLVKVNAFLGQ